MCSKILLLNGLLLNNCSNADVVMDHGNLSNWKSVFLQPTAPYLTDEGFLNPGCFKKSERMSTNTNTYIIGADEGCLSEDAKTLCNGPLKPKTHYV